MIDSTQDVEDREVSLLSLLGEKETELQELETNISLNADEYLLRYRTLCRGRTALYSVIESLKENLRQIQAVKEVL